MRSVGSNPTRSAIKIKSAFCRFHFYHERIDWFESCGFLIHAQGSKQVDLISANAIKSLRFPRRHQRCRGKSYTLRQNCPQNLSILRGPNKNKTTKQVVLFL